MNGLSKISPYAQLMRFDRPIGTGLLMLPCWWSVAFIKETRVLSSKDFYYWLGLFTLGAFLMRSAGCIFNDWADQELDKGVARTRNRPLANGLLSSTQAIAFFFLTCCLGGFVFYLLPQHAQFYALISLFLLLLYPFMKRITHFPQLVMGASFSMGIPIAWATLIPQESLPLEILLLYLASLLWGAGYDTIYGLQDYKEDQEIGIKSIAVRFRFCIRWVIGGFYGAFWLSLIAVGFLAKFNGFYYLTVGVVGFLILAQQFLLNPEDPRTCLKQFKSNFWIGLLVFIGLLLGKA